MIELLLQEVQMCIKRDEDFVELLCHLYKNRSEQIFESPVSIKHGYGYACGKKKTFKERIDRFLMLLKQSSDSLKRLYSVNMNVVAGYLLLFDYGALDLPEDARIRAEEGEYMKLCGGTVQHVFSAAIDLRKGETFNQFVAGFPLLYKRVNGASAKPTDQTEIVLAENLIRMDRVAIESIKIRNEGTECTLIQNHELS